ncbi:Retrovirus-related Pol polyprotein from transposon RE1 [Vitis vinifera]|uniref:Retrovirus-related Pol polyprotein from transposon RE1 n=1 Tax=Vitis vinifera TaxID=29760 RepID=A0A438IB59_VITVI|nr:Retrovirus-related Pol polyprotein from transposon RE1 [Vitis vinifera]
MHSEFEMSMMGELNFFLRLQIKQQKEGTFINQPKYIRDLLKRFNMEEAKTMKTLMSSSIKLDKDEKGKSVNSTMYRGMIGSLLYLTASRPDIIYLKGTMDIGLWYLKGDNFELIGFSDANFAGCKVERKSTSDTCHFLGHSLVSWHSKKQNSVALSTTEAEYIAAGERRTPLGLRASALLSHLSLSRWRLAERRGMTPPSLVPSKIISNTNKNSTKGKSSQGEAFYSLVTYGLGGPILFMVRGVEIKLSLESICRILDIPSVVLQVYEVKAWPTMPGFEPREGSAPPFHSDISLPPLHPAVAITSGCRHFPPGCITFRILLPPPFHPDILHSAPNAGWERRAFQLPRSAISGSSDSAYPESFAAIFAQCRGVLLKLPNMRDRHFEIFWDILV